MMPQILYNIMYNVSLFIKFLLHSHTDSNNSELTILLLIFLKIFSYIPPLLIDGLDILMICCLFYWIVILCSIRINILLLLDWLTSLEFNLDPTTLSHTLLQYLEFIVFYPMIWYHLNFEDLEKALHEHKVFYHQLPQLMEDNQKYQYNTSKYLNFHIFLNINHKNRRLE